MNELRNLSNGRQGPESHVLRMANEPDQPNISDFMTLLQMSIETHNKASQAMQELSEAIRLQANAIAALVEAQTADDNDDDEPGFQTLDGR